MPFIPFIKDPVSKEYLHTVTLDVNGVRHIVYIHPEMLKSARMAMSNELRERLMDSVLGLPITEQTKEMANMVIEEYWQSLILAGGIEF